MFDATGQLLTDASNTTTPSDYFAAAKTAKLTNHDGTTFEFDVIDLDFGYAGFGQSSSKAARLTRYRDRAGYGFAVNYKTWTPEQITESPERQWQIAQVLGDAGDALTFTYAEQQVAGCWVVSQVQLPNGEAVSYSYGNGMLQSVQHPGGGVSTFAHTFDTASMQTKLTINDVTTFRGHPRKEVYLSPNTYHHLSPDSAYLLNQAAQQVRIVMTGQGNEREVAYLNFPDPSGVGYNNIYLGAGRMLQRPADFLAGTSAHFKSGATINLESYMGAMYGAQVVGELENQSVGSSGLSFAQYTTSSSGITRFYALDAEGWTIGIGHSDNTFTTMVRNERKQPVRIRDRQGHVTRHTYDAHGNRISTEVGLQEAPVTIQINYGNLEYVYSGSSSGGESSSHGEHDPHGGHNSHGSSPSGPTTTLQPDTPTDDYAILTWEYFPVGHAHQNLLSAAIDALGNRTDYEYDAQHRLIKVMQPADSAGAPRAETLYAYDAVGRLSVVTDPEGHETTYFYDGSNRVSKISYADASSERYFYGTGGTADLLVKQVDRRGVVTHHEYDSAGRRIRSVVAAGVMDLAGGETPVSDPSVTYEETVSYLNGTNHPVIRTRAGETTEFAYDYRQRVIESRAQPKSGTTLVSKQIYANNQLFATEDPYGRRTYNAYDLSDGRLIRSVQTTVEGVTFANQAAVLAATRSAQSAPNTTLLITDHIHDAEGQTTSVIDPRGVASTTTYDSRGRAVEQVQAASVLAGGTLTPIPAKSETIYNAASQVVEVRSPRYFDANDTNGVNTAKTVMTYTGRGRPTTRTEAPGTPQAATESYVYDIAGHQISKTDARGHVWQTLRPNCCGRVQLSVDPLGHGTITRTDWNGNVVHQATVADVLSHENTSDPLNAKTLQEVTTKYDLRNRPVARTVWLTPRGAVVFTDPPIAGDEGIAATEGITTRYQYDDDLTDGVGLDQQFSQHLAGLNLGTGCNGNAALVTNPEGERTLSIKDGLGRAVRSMQLDANGAAVVSSTTTHDTVVTVADYGAVLETSSANALGHTTKQRTDGAGRTIESVDAENHVTSFEYDANGNRKKVRDPNGVGQDCVYDALNRDVSCSDTQELLSNLARTTTYDLAGNVLAQADAKGNITYSYFDARGRRFETKDRNNATTSFTFDAGGLELSMTDAENQTTSYEYDQLGRRTKIVWPDHVAGQNPGDANCGFTTTAYDAAGRAVSKQDRLGETAALVYDMAGRMLAREYRTLANSTIATPNTGLGPFVTGNIADQDTFTYDAAGKMLTAVKGRYSNTVTFTYENGRKLTETLAIFGQTYTVTSGYDQAGRENSLTYPDGTLVNRTHTNRGQLASVTLTEPSAVASSVATFTYDNGGRETSRLYGNGVETTRAYAADNMVTTIAAANVETLSYTYDENKNPTSETRSGVMAAHSWSTGATGFDPQNRLTNWTKTNGDSQQWQLSPVNDWQSFTNNGSPQTRTHGPTHELASLTNAGANTPTALQHDTKGNLTQDERGCLLTYDPDNMLSAFAPNGAESQSGNEHLKPATYQYDALGRRVAKSVTTLATGNDPSSTTNTIYTLSGQQVIAEYVATGTGSLAVSTRMTHGSYIDEPLVLLSTLNSQPSTLYYHQNRQYSTNTLTDATGAPVERYTYTPYGAATTHNPAGTPTGPTPQTPNRTLFTGRTLDTESAFNCFRGRYYSVSLGRFTNHDPIEYPDGWNTYSAWFVPARIDPHGNACAIATGACTGLFPGSGTGPGVSDGRCTTFAWMMGTCCTSCQLDVAEACCRSKGKVASTCSKLKTTVFASMCGDFIWECRDEKDDDLFCCRYDCGVTTVEVQKRVGQPDCSDYVERNFGSGLQKCFLDIRYGGTCRSKKKKK